MIEVLFMPNLMVKFYRKILQWFFCFSVFAYFHAVRSKEEGWLFCKSNTFLGLQWWMNRKINPKKR